MLLSLTIVRYKKALIPLAFLAMAIHRLPLWLNPACKFWKLMGCGKNGSFSIKPDLQQWALLAVWNNQDEFNKFQKHSFISGWWKKFCNETFTILCIPVASRGKWDNKEPFDSTESTELNGPVAVLTRATIRLNRLKNFWQNVDKVSRLMHTSPGYITSFGIGEAPYYRQATFSLWENTDSVKAFAYGSKEHTEVIKKTRQENWYSEELFARFKTLSCTGTINGINPLEGKI
ncbi:DUF3291 domain-containing protein [Desertivirga xinjiangensis]|uniref:DUF3291 domain-containing protein n=1 Tax=Desertivirga xinjiangensis TaxID=539206 RepID=UPI00210E10CB|nr:DUF3291 domain-containing protein [Pedobacter xinjiangensis]